MSIHLIVSDELEARLRRRAIELGETVEHLATDLLSAALSNPPTYLTGQELVDAWEQDGVIGYRADIEDSARHAREIRERAERRDL